MYCFAVMPRYVVCVERGTFFSFVLEGFLFADKLKRLDFFSVTFVYPFVKEGLIDGVYVLEILWVILGGGVVIFHPQHRCGAVSLLVLPRVRRWSSTRIR